MNSEATIYFYGSGTGNGSILSESAAINQLISRAITTLGIDRADDISSAIELAREDSIHCHSTFVQCLSYRLETLMNSTYR